MTSLGHVTASPIDSTYAISYRCPVGHSTVFEIFGPQIPCARAHRETDRHTPQMIWYSAPRNVLHWTDNSNAHNYF